MIELWDVVKPPVVDEDDSNTGTSLYAPAFHLFRVRLLLSIILMGLASAHHDRHKYFSNVYTVFYLFQSAAFLLLAAASLCVALDLAVRICGPFVEWMYFATNALSIAATSANSFYYPALIITLLHYSTAPKIRVRPCFVIILVLCFIPHTEPEILFPRRPTHENVDSLFKELFGLTSAGVIVLVLAEVTKYAEIKQRVQIVDMHSIPDSYSAI